MRIDVTRYTEDKSCATAAGLKAKLLADLGPVIHGIKLQRNRCLVATYLRPNVTGGGIILTTKTGEEERWQGKVGLLLKIGPSAFDYEEIHQYMGEVGADIDGAHRAFGIPQVGDWVVYRTSETHEMGIEVVPGVCASCRQIFDDSIIMAINDPSVIW